MACHSAIEEKDSVQKCVGIGELAEELGCLVPGVCGCGVSWVCIVVSVSQK